MLNPTIFPKLEKAITQLAFTGETDIVFREKEIEVLRNKKTVNTIANIFSSQIKQKEVKIFAKKDVHNCIMLILNKSKLTPEIIRKSLEQSIIMYNDLAHKDLARRVKRHLNIEDAESFITNYVKSATLDITVAQFHLWRVNGDIANADIDLVKSAILKGATITEIAAKYDLPLTFKAL